MQYSTLRDSPGADQKNLAALLTTYKRNMQWFGQLCGVYLTVGTPTNLRKGNNALLLIKAARIKSTAEIKVSKKTSNPQISSKQSKMWANPTDP